MMLIAQCGFTKTNMLYIKTKEAIKIIAFVYSLLFPVFFWMVLLKYSLILFFKDFENKLFKLLNFMVDFILLLPEKLCRTSSTTMFYLCKLTIKLAKDYFT